MGHGREGSSYQAVGHDNVWLGARPGNNLVVVGGAEAVVNRGRGDWMLMEKSGARVVVLCMGSLGARVGDNSAKGFGS